MFHWGTLCRLLKKQKKQPLGRRNGRERNETLQGLQGGEGIGGEGELNDWTKQGLPPLICKPCLYQGSLGTSPLNQVHSVHQASANPPPCCPQGVKCAPNPFPARPITQQTYSRRRAGKGTDSLESRAQVKPLSHSHTPSGSEAK